MEENMEPPQAKMISVPFSYQPLAMASSSGEALKLAPYCQEYLSSTVMPSSLAAALTPCAKP